MEIDPRVSKLPKWAQDQIADLSRERDTAIRALNAFVDDQTPSAFSYRTRLSTGESQGPALKTRYIQTHGVDLCWGGMEVLMRANMYKRDTDPAEITIQYDSQNSAAVLLTPVAYQRLTLRLL